MTFLAHFGLVMQGQLDIEGITCIINTFFTSTDICISCGSTNIVAQHPLFHGGLCRKCKVSQCYVQYVYCI